MFDFAAINKEINRKTEKSFVAKVALARKKWLSPYDNKIGKMARFFPLGYERKILNWLTVTVYTI